MIGIPKVGKANLRNIALRACAHTGNNLYMTLHRFIDQKAFGADRVDGIHYEVKLSGIQQFGDVLVFQVDG